MLLALGSTLSNLLSSRTNEAVTTFVKQAEVGNDPERARVALATGFCFDLGIAALTLAAFLLFTGAIGDHLLKLPGSGPAIVVFALSICSSTIRGTAQGLLIARGRFALLSGLTCAEQGLKVALVALPWLRGDGLTLFDAANALLISSGTVTAFALVLLLADARRRPSGSGDPGGLRWEFVKYSFSTFISTTLKAGHKNLDTLAVGSCTDPTTAGVYATIRQSLAPLAFLAAPFSTVSAPQFVAQAAAGRAAATNADIARINARMSLVMTLLGGASAAGLAVYAHLQGLTLGLIGWSCFLLLATSSWLANALWWTRPFSLAYDPNLSIRANLLAAGVMLIAVFPLCAAIGVLGAAAGSLGISLVLTIYWRSALAASRRRRTP